MKNEDTLYLKRAVVIRFTCMALGAPIQNTKFIVQGPRIFGPLFRRCVLYRSISLMPRLFSGGLSDESLYTRKQSISWPIRLETYLTHAAPKSNFCNNPSLHPSPPSVGTRTPSRGIITCKCKICSNIAIHVAEMYACRSILFRVLESSERNNVTITSCSTLSSAGR